MLDYKQLSRVLRRLKATDGTNEKKILAALAENPYAEMTNTEVWISCRTIDRNKVSVVLKRLHRMGFVERRNALDDPRKTLNRLAIGQVQHVNEIVEKFNNQALA